MRKETYKVLISTALGVAAGLSACEATGVTNFIPDSQPKNPNSTEIDPTLVPFPKIEPLNEKDIKVFLDNCQNCDELGITMETVAGGYFNGDFLFHSKDKNDADYFYLNQGTSFEPLNWESTDSEFALVPKANEGDIYTGLKYFIWNPNVTDDSGNMIVTYQPDGTPNSAQKFILPSNNDIEPRLKRARFIKPEISPESLLPQEVKEKFEELGAELGKDENGNPIYYVTNRAGETVIVGKMNEEGNKWELGDAVKYTLSVSKEEAQNNFFDYDFVMRGGPGEIAKLNAEPFPEDVITGLNVVALIPNINIKYYNYLYFDRNGENIIKRNPGKEPYRNMGWFSFVNEVGQQGYGTVWQWINPDKSIVYLTTVSYAGADPNLIRTPFVKFNFTIETPNFTTAATIGKNQELNTLIQQWADTDIIPVELQYHALPGYSAYNP